MCQIEGLMETKTCLRRRCVCWTGRVVSLDVINIMLIFCTTKYGNGLDAAVFITLIMRSEEIYNRIYL